MKVFRLVKAELRKIFLRPTIFIMIAVLLVASFISLFAFFPDTKAVESTIEIQGDTVGSIYNNFMQPNVSTTHTTKAELDAKLDQKLNDVYLFTQNDQILIDLNNIAGLNVGAQAQIDYQLLIEALERAARPANMSPSLVYQEANNCLENFKNSLSGVIMTLAKFETSDKYYLAQSEYESIKDTLTSLSNVVIAHKSHQSSKVYDTMLSTIRKFRFDEVVPEFISKVAPILISTESYDAIKADYYDTSKTTLGTIDTEGSLMHSIHSFYLENAGEGGQEYRETMINLLSDYKAYVNLACENLECATQIEVGKDKSDKEMQKFINYESYNKLLSSSALQKNAYMVNNNINPRTTLDSINFGVNSGNETNAWDFICFSMNISCLVIIIFCVLICSKIIAGEQAGGTMKLLAIRPFTRSKILGGKLLATMFFSMIFIAFSFIINFALGWAKFGLPGQMMIGVFNGTSVIYSHPIVFCIFLLLSLFIKTFVYVSIATMISVIFRSYTGSSMVSFGIVIVTLILNGVLATKSWFKYFPMANFDLYKYFTTTQAATGFKAIFSSPLIIDTNFFFSFLYTFGLIILFNVISFFLFRRKDIA